MIGGFRRGQSGCDDGRMNGGFVVEEFVGKLGRVFVVRVGVFIVVVGCWDCG